MSSLWHLGNSYNPNMLTQGIFSPQEKAQPLFDLSMGIMSKFFKSGGLFAQFELAPMVSIVTQKMPGISQIMGQKMPGIIGAKDSGRGG